MKKITVSTAALLLFASISFAAETKDSNSTKSVNQSSSSSTFITPRNMAEVIEENAVLRLKVEDLTAEAETLSEKLNFSSMMHATINNLQQEVLSQKEEDAKMQLDYARMMGTTIVNLSNVLSSTN